MKHIITLSFLLLATTFAGAQSVEGLWHESSYGMGHHGKLVYDESISIKDSVYVDGIVPLMRHVRYQYHGQTDDIELQGDTVPGLLDTVITGNYLFERTIFGLESNPESAHTWDVKVWYTTINGVKVDELTVWFQEVQTRRSANIYVSPTFAWPDANGYLQYNVSVNTEYDGSIHSFVHIRATSTTSSFVYEPPAQEIEIANWYVQQMTFVIYPWQPDSLCVQIWVTRSDSWNDFSDVVVDVADLYDMDCVNFGDFSTSSVEEAELPAFELFPNPTTDFITIKNLDSIQPIDVYDMLGQQVKHFQSNGQTTATHDVSNLAEGMYVLKQGDDRVARFEVKH